MTAKEMMELAKAGYKPTEIAEMHKLMKEADPEAKEEPKDEPKTEPIPEPKAEPKVEPTPEPKEEPKDDKDYKALYEESQKKLIEAQKNNIKKDASGSEPNNDDILADLVRGFM